MSKEKYEIQFNRAVEDINRVVGVNIIEDAILKIVYDMNYKCYGTVCEKYGETNDYIQDFLKEELCELIAEYLDNIDDAIDWEGMKKYVK